MVNILQKLPYINKDISDVTLEILLNNVTSFNFEIFKIKG